MFRDIKFPASVFYDHVDKSRPFLLTTTQKSPSLRNSKKMRFFNLISRFIATVNHNFFSVTLHSIQFVSMAKCAKFFSGDYLDRKRIIFCENFKSTWM